MRVLALVSLLAAAYAVDHSKFRTCKQTNFCLRKRTAEPGRAYVVGPSSVSKARAFHGCLFEALRLLAFPNPAVQ